MKLIAEAKAQLQEAYKDDLAACVLKVRLELFEELHAGKHFDYASENEELKYEIASSEDSNKEQSAEQVEPPSDLPLVIAAF